MRETLFGKGGLVPDLMNSWELRAKFVAVQKEASDCAEWKKPLEVALRHLSFAPQRWDSEASPLRRFAATLVPVALYLAMQSTDRRHKPAFRQKCAETLRRLQPAFLVDCGLCGDWAQEWVRFLRVFDREDHDSALTARQKSEFSSRLTTLFVDCHILDDPADSDATTLTRLIVQQAMQCPGIRYGESMHYLWPGTAKHTFDRCIQSLHAVADVALQDLDGELNGFVLDFTVWDIKAFHLAKKKPQDWDNFKKLTDLRLRRLIRSGLKRLDAAETMREWWTAAHCLQEELAAKLDRGEEIDNRQEWRKVFDEGFVRRATSWGHFKMLPSFLNYYLGFRDSSTGVERALAQLTRLRNAHLGPLCVTMHDLLEIAMDGPSSEEDLASRFFEDGDRDVVLRATDMSLELVHLWRSMFGSRFRLYKTRADKGQPRVKRGGTEASLIRQTAAGTDLLVRNAGTVSDRSKTILGVKRKDLPQHDTLQRNPQFNQSLEDVYNSAAQKKQKKLDARNQRRDHPESRAYEPGPLRKAQLVAEPVPPRSAGYNYTRKQIAKVVDLTVGGSAFRCDSATIMRPSGQADILSFLQTSDLIVVSSFAHLQFAPKFNDVLWLGTK
ncbi:unnamed protein product [Symbiodinium sp. CCMP2592]|nr:unnamed protein product [Symbiodinium sp. CCMP2592]